MVNITDVAGNGKMVDANLIVQKIIFFGSVIADWLTNQLEKMGVDALSSTMLILVYLVGIFLVIKAGEKIKGILKIAIIGFIIWLIIGTVKNLF